MRPSAAYLVLYNSTQAAGWASILYLTVSSILAHGGAAHVFEAAGPVVSASCPGQVSTPREQHAFPVLTRGTILVMPSPWRHMVHPVQQ